MPSTLHFGYETLLTAAGCGVAVSLKQTPDRQRNTKPLRGLVFSKFLPRNSMEKKIENPARPASSNILDYPSTMSGYQRESLAAEAKLAAGRKVKKQRKVAKSDTT